MSAGPVLASEPADAEAMRALLAGPWRPAGRFARYALPDGAATCPVALARAPRRLTAVTALTARWPAPGLAPSPAVSFRLATAARQDLWRALRHARGLAPVAVARLADGEATVAAAAGWLDFAAAAPGALDALAEIFHEAAVRRWTDWASRA